MRKVREVLRLKHAHGLSEREIAGAVGVGNGTVSEYIKRATQAGLTWEEAAQLSDAEVEGRLFTQVGRNEPASRAPVDFGWVHLELRRVGVTLQTLWVEYREAVVAGGSGRKPYQYSQFCDLYRKYARKLSPVMRQTHVAGKKAFIDFSGKKPRIVEPTTGEETEVELFVMVLGASNYTYAEAVPTQELAHFTGATVRGLEYFGAVPEMLVPDQLRSAVKTPDRYEPEINATYAELSQHYGTAVVPARPRKPRDKAKVEGAVLLAQRWILACLRNRRFFSLEELNAAVWELLERLNTRPFQKLEGCRRSAFEALERPAMRPLPARRYEMGAWKLNVGVNLDHHIEYDHRYYSVPSVLITEKVDVRATATVIEVWRNNARVTSHERSYGPRGTAVTKEEHRPRAHREWGEWPSERLVSWAKTKGPKTAEVATAILERGQHPESGRRACLGLMRLGEQQGDARLEAACLRALAIGSPTYKSVKAILSRGLEKGAMTDEAPQRTVVHENIRGGDYFDRQEVSLSGGDGGDDEIEARYLEEERQAIILEPTIDSVRGPHRIHSVVERQAMKVSSGGVAGSYIPPAGAPTEPLSALLGRLEKLMVRPLPAARIGRLPRSERGGVDYGSEERDGLSCTSESVCVPELTNDDETTPSGGEERVSRRREKMADETLCEIDEAWFASPRGGRGDEME